MLSELIFKAALYFDLAATDSDFVEIECTIDNCVYTIYTTMQAAGVDQETADIIINILF